MLACLGKCDRRWAGGTSVTDPIVLTGFDIGESRRQVLAVRFLTLCPRRERRGVSDPAFSTPSRN